jgi:hypothetical protein
MALTTTANLSSFINWTTIESNGLSRLSDIGSVESEQNFTDGTGNLKCDIIWHAIRTASGNSYDSLDLTSLSFDLFGIDSTLSFNNIKGIAIKNTNETIGNKLGLAATGSDAFTTPFNGGSGDLPIYPTDCLVLANSIVGWTVDSSHKYLSVINNNATGINYEIAIVGVTG